MSRAADRGSPAPATPGAGPGDLGGAARSPRLHAFDALRAASILGIFLWHAGLAYAEPSLRFWVLRDPSASVAFSLPLWFSRGFRLATFFVMSGFFARLALERGTPGGFVRQRLLRIGVPFALAVLAFNALLMAAPGVLARWAPPDGLWPPHRLRPLHLWFLEQLLIISGVVLVAALVLPRVVPARWIARARAAFATLLGRWWGPLVLVPFTVVILHEQGGQYPRTSPTDLVPDAGTMVYFGIFFVFGWWLHAGADALPRLCRHAWSWIAAGLCVRALTLFPLLPGLTPATLLDGSYAWEPSPHYLERALQLPEGDELLVQVLADVYAWLMIFGLMGVFLRLFRREIPLVRWFADGSYWLYLVHLLPVVLLQLGLQAWWPDATTPGEALVRYLLVVVGSLVVVLGSYEVCVRYTAVGRLLNGPRRRPPGGRRQCWRWRAPDGRPGAG